MLTLLALLTLTSAQERFPPEVERAIMAVDLDGFSTGKCWDFLPPEVRDIVSEGQARFDARPPRPRPVLDQVFYGAVVRGKADALRNPPDSEHCEFLRQGAAEGLAEQDDALGAFEASLHPSLQRSVAP